MVHSDGKILMDLKMEMWRVHAVIGSDRPHLLSFADLLALAHTDPIKVRVERVGELQLAVLDPSVSDHHDISPCHMHIPRQHNDSVADSIDRAP
jgi:hypothetical protein